MTQNNLGNALAVLGERENNVAKLREAMAAWEACLTISETAWPQEWVQWVRGRRNQTQLEIARITTG